MKEYVKNEFMKLEKDIILPNKRLFPSPVTLDEFLWAFGILRSRAFSRLRNENLVVIPLADLVRRNLSFSLFSVSLTTAPLEQREERDKQTYKTVYDIPRVDIILALVQLKFLTSRTCEKKY